MSWLPTERPWTPRDALRVGFGALAIALGTVFLVSWAKTYAMATNPADWQKDWYQLWLAGGRFTRGEWADLYTRDFSKDRYFWLYPPFALWLVAPLAALPAGVGYLVIVAIQTLATSLSVRLLGPDPHGDAATALAGTFGSAAFASVVIVGQNSGLLSLVAVGSAVALEAGRDGLAGMILGLLIVKPNWLAPFALMLLIRRQWRAFGGVAVVCALAMVSTLPLGRGLWADFFASSRGVAVLLSQSYDVWKLITVQAFLRSVLPADWVAPSWAAAELAALAAYVAALVVEKDPRRQVAFTVLFLVVANVYVNFYDGLVLLVPAIVWWNGRAAYNAVSRAVVGACVLLVWVWQWVSVFGVQASVAVAPVGAIVAVWLAAEAYESRRRTW